MSTQSPKQTTFLTNKMPMLPKTLANPVEGEHNVPTPTAPLAEITWRLVLHIGHDSSTAVGVELTDSAIIGRHDNTLALSPELDLTPYGGFQAGVSRRHARLFVHDRGLYIQDLGSTNGTFVNEYSLQPELPYRLQDNDILDVGEIRIRLNIIRAGY